MKKITLKFKSPQELWEFKMFAKLNSVEIDLKRFILTSECEDQDINLALQKYHAQVNNELISFTLQ